jgi:hypothetical protein
MRDDVRHLWAATKVLRWKGGYWLASFAHDALPTLAAALPASGDEFAALVVERDEVSLTVSDATWRRVREIAPARRVAGPFAVLTLSLDLDLGVCGYLAPAASRLGDAGIAVVPQAAFLKDHILVHESDADRAVAVLESLAADCRR